MGIHKHIWLSFEASVSRRPEWRKSLACTIIIGRQLLTPVLVGGKSESASKKAKNRHTVFVSM